MFSRRPGEAIYLAPETGRGQLERTAPSNSCIAFVTEISSAAPPLARFVGSPPLPSLSTYNDRRKKIILDKVQIKYAWSIILSRYDLPLRSERAFAYMYVGFITPWEVALGATLLLWLLCWRCALSRARW